MHRHRWYVSRTLVFITGHIALQALVTTGIAGEAIDGQTVLNAWAKRKAKVASLQYESRVERAVAKPLGPGNPDPFKADGGFGPDAVLQVLRRETLFSLSGEKIAYRVKREREGKRLQSVLWASFDGQENRNLTAGSGPATGGIEKSVEPGDRLTVNTDEVAFYFAYSPADYMGRTGCDLTQMSVRQAHVKVDGRDCVEFVFPRKRHSPWMGFVYVDPKRDFVPVRWSEHYDGVLMLDVHVQYAAHDRVGWVATGWTHNQFNEKGKQQATVTGKVTRCSINEPLDDAVFKVVFPEGAYVVEEPGRKYFRQEEGKLVPIAEDEYNKALLVPQHN